MTTHPTSVADPVIERHRPPSRSNPSVARSGHNCDLPVWVGFPVSLNPDTCHRAEPGLVVHCEICDALWKVVNAPRNMDGPDLIWVEQTPRRMSSRSWLLGRAIRFNVVTAWAKPDPATIDWSEEKPLRPNGMPWWQMDFEEMLGHGVDQCTSTYETGYGPIGGPMSHYTLRCVLKVEHQGLHESPDPHSGACGWS